MSSSRILLTLPILLIFPTFLRRSIHEQFFFSLQLSPTRSAMTRFDRLLQADIARLQAYNVEACSRLNSIVSTYKSQLHSTTNFSLSSALAARKDGQPRGEKSQTTRQKEGRAALSSKIRRPLAVVDQNALPEKQLMPPPRLTRSRAAKKKGVELERAKRKNEHLGSEVERPVKTAKRDMPSSSPAASPVHNDAGVGDYGEVQDGSSIHNEARADDDCEQTEVTEAPKGSLLLADSRQREEKENDGRVDNPVSEADNAQSTSTDVGDTKSAMIVESASDEESPVVKRGGRGRERRVRRSSEHASTREATLNHSEHSETASEQKGTDRSEVESDVSEEESAVSRDEYGASGEESGASGEESDASGEDSDASEEESDAFEEELCEYEKRSIEPAEADKGDSGAVTDDEELDFDSAADGEAKEAQNLQSPEKTQSQREADVANPAAREHTVEVPGPVRDSVSEEGEKHFPVSASGASPSAPPLREASVISNVKSESDNVVNERNRVESEGQAQNAYNEPAVVQHATQEEPAANSFEYKVPKPRQKRLPTWTLREQPTSGPVSCSLNKVPRTSQRQTHDPSATSQPETESTRGSRFEVDESSKVNMLGIGALSEIVSTPAANALSDIMDTQARTEVNNVRPTRLFNPTANIYSETKKFKSNSTFRAFGSKQTSMVMRTPGATTPVRKLPSSAHQSYESLKRQFSKDALLNDMTTISQESVLARRVLTVPSTPPKTAGEGPVWSARGEVAVSAASKETPKICTRSAQNEASSSAEHPGPAMSPGRDAFNKLDMLLREKKRLNAPTFGSLTAPGKPVFSRIERKPVKSALRRDIENMRAGKSLSIPAKPGIAQQKSASSPQLSRAADTPKTRDETVTADPDTRPTSGRTIEPRSPPPTILKKRLQRNDGFQSPTLQRSAHKSHARKSVHFQLESTPPREKAIAAHHLDSELKPESIVKSEPRHSSPGTFVGSEDVDLNDSNSNGEDPTGSASSSEPDDASSLKQEEVAAALDKPAPPQGSFSNLVSSVASFLPGASALFGGRTEEVTPEFEARETAKRAAQDAQRRDAELAARREVARATRQREAEDKQRRAERRRRQLAQAMQHKEEERVQREEARQRKRAEEEERLRARKEEEDRKKAQHRQRVLAQKRQLEAAALQAKRALTERAARQKGGGGGGGGGGGTSSVARPTQAVATGATATTSGMTERPAALSGLSGGVGAMGSTDRLPPRTPKGNRTTETNAGEVTSYDMTAERKRTDSEGSEERRRRRKRKPVPAWAGGEKLLGSLREQGSDPDTVFSRVFSCNLEDVFQGEESKRKRRPRGSSGNWTKDRLTAREEMEYKKKEGFFNNA